MWYKAIMVLIGATLFSSVALAQGTATADKEPTFITQTKAPLAWLRFRRFLSVNPVKDSELTLAIANRLALQIEDVDDSKATSLIDQYNQETANLQELVNAILASNTDPNLNAFLTVLVSDKTAQIAALESAHSNDTSELGRKIINTRAKTLKEIVKILEHPNLTPAEQQEKLNAVMEKYSEAETKIDQKITRKLALKNEIDETTTDQELEDDLADYEDEAVSEASKKLNKDELTDFADELRRKEGDQSLVVLQKLLVTVPDSAKSGIETAIDAVIANKIVAFRQNPALVEQLLDEHSGSSKVRTLLLDRIKEQAQDENLKKQIEILKEKPEEQAKKLQELQKETKSSEKESTEKSEDKSSTSSETKSEAVTVEIKVKEDGTLEKTSYTVKKNSSVTIKIESESVNSVTLSFSNGLGSVTVNKDDKKSLSAFTITGTVSFTVNGVTAYIYTE